jgi:glycerol-3-phosphate dehydrogenase
MRDAKQRECINTQHYNPKYLSEYKLPDNIGGIHVCNEEQLKEELETPGVVVILALPCMSKKTPV